MPDNALIVAYALSRLDQRLLDALGYGTWREAFAATSSALKVPHNSIKLLRDEFDVFFPNGRRGWAGRPPHPTRMAILHEFMAVSDDALIETVTRILANDDEAVQEVLQLVATPLKRVANVAERLLTGRRAEEHFMRACQQIIDVPPDALRDRRQDACGFDFSSSALPDVALEVKGLKSTRGGILFTDREWSEARERRENYWVVLVGNLGQVSDQTKPIVRVFPDPIRALKATCEVIPSASTLWAANASVL